MGRAQNHVDLSCWLVELLDGLLLSDASLILTPSKHSALIQMAQHPSRLGWLEHLVLLLEYFGVQSDIRSITVPSGFIRGKPVRGGEYVRLRSRSYVELKEQRLRWYPMGIKGVPSDLRLTPFSVAHWFSGDGYGGDRRGLLGFATDGFSRFAVEELQKRLDIDLGVTANISKETSGGYRVRVGRKGQASKLARMLMPHLAACCQYKLRYANDEI